MKLPMAFVESGPRDGTSGIYYQVFNKAGIEVAAGRGENSAQAHEIAVRLLNLLCEQEAEATVRQHLVESPIPF